MCYHSHLSHSTAWTMTQLRLFLLKLSLKCCHDSFCILFVTNLKEITQKLTEISYTANNMYYSSIVKLTGFKLEYHRLILRMDTMVHMEFVSHRNKTLYMGLFMERFTPLWGHVHVHIHSDFCEIQYNAASHKFTSKFKTLLKTLKKISWRLKK